MNGKRRLPDRRAPTQEMLWAPDDLVRALGEVESGHNLPDGYCPVLCHTGPCYRIG
jgi:hypothetical protein